ncbi:hypothetical protein VTK73DRAFT_5399 [Phialemonium thermophilum]|uniref:Alpha/beta hydrolase fold-3 domain-containing protein n=1 Tax=Phialemonium thermophilum TaxID=223376 RepID=A0ABR3XYJ6_9PEZI
MDNSRFGIPSKEWREYSDARPKLRLDEDGFHDDVFSSPERLRAAANAAKERASRFMFAHDKLANQVTMSDFAIPTRDGSSIPMRKYQSTTSANGSAVVKVGNAVEEPVAESLSAVPAFIYFHGGGMLFGSIDGEMHTCASLARDLARGGSATNSPGVIVLHVCYRHVPEFTHPVQHQDAWDAFEWIFANAAILGIDVGNLVIGGISAGGSLAASVVFRELERAQQTETASDPRIHGQVLFIPWLIHRDAYPLDAFAAPEIASLVACADSPTLPRPRYDMFTDLSRVADPRADALMNIGLALETTLKGMPRTAIVANGWDMLRDEAFLYADKLERVGVPVKKHVFPGMPHAFRKYPDLPSSRRWDELMVESIRWCLTGKGKADVVGEWIVEGPIQGT